MERIRQANTDGSRPDEAGDSWQPWANQALRRETTNSKGNFAGMLIERAENPLDHNISYLVNAYNAAYGNRSNKAGDGGRQLYRNIISSPASGDEPINQHARASFESRMRSRWVKQKAKLVELSGNERILDKLNASDSRINTRNWYQAQGEQRVIDAYRIKEIRTGDSRVVMPSSAKSLVEHCFYLNPSPQDLYKILDGLVDQYDRSQTPFSLKYAERPRSSHIVIYSTSRQLEDNYRAIHRVCEQQPAMVERLRPPLATVGIIDTKIGYSQGISRINGMRADVSYNLLRAGLITRALDHTMANWLIEHQSDRIKYGNKKIAVAKLMAKQLADSVTAQSKRGDVRDLVSTGFIERRIINKLNELVGMVDANNYTPTGIAQSIEIHQSGDRSLRLPRSSMQSCMASLAPWVNNNDRAFAQQLKDSICELSPQYHVNALNFILDDNDVYNSRS